MFFHSRVAPALTVSFSRTYLDGLSVIVTTTVLPAARATGGPLAGMIVAPAGTLSSRSKTMSCFA